MQSGVGQVKIKMVKKNLILCVQLTSNKNDLLKI
jgi:hypothetical protein